ILDSFAGSGTTAHAVLNLNKQDGGNRKFILVEMEDYAETITAERVRRVMNGYGQGKKAVAGTGGSFDYYMLGPRLFDEHHNLNEEVGAEQIRAYVWYTETRSELPVVSCRLSDGTGQASKAVTRKVRPATDNKYYLGTHDDTAYYFVYEKDRLTVLDYDTLALLKTKAGHYVIYADNCVLPKAFLEEHGITFKKIPRDITRF
ncbi:MAG: site-specific DNA-methyltransferase, partial [Flavobacteriales bacterium]|nr:site-specific DNA-methyltransferase [Flavobacteriales bacterium]MBP9080465.1 site-specific DNA-methyltransferase [Flavobacteriales bacterium]